MLLRQIFIAAIGIGLVAGGLFGTFQQSVLSPLLVVAERYEHAASADNEVGEARVEVDTPRRTSPLVPPSRRLATLLTSGMVGVALALLLLAAMLWHNLKTSKPAVSWRSGLGWGIALWWAIVVAPALLGLGAEIPGTLAAPLATRQSGWVFGVGASVAGLAVLYYGRLWQKCLGGGLLALPHLAAAVQSPVSSVSSIPFIPHGFIHTEPAIVATLTALSSRFILLTALGMLLFCVVLGGLSGWACARFIRWP